MGCATGIVKYLVFLFNLIFALAGLTLVAVGVITILNIKGAANTFEDAHLNINIAPTLLIIVGGIVFVISFFGCCGAVRDSSCMLTTYAVILLALFVLQIAIGVYAFLQVKDEGDLRSQIRKGIQKTFELYNKDDPSREAMDFIQQTVKCCGVDRPSDYYRIPASCCASNKPSCSSADPTLFDDGCAKGLYQFVRDSSQMLGYVALGLCATELIAAVFSLCLSSSIRNAKRRGAYA